MLGIGQDMQAAENAARWVFSGGAPSDPVISSYTALEAYMVSTSQDYDDFEAYLVGAGEDYDDFEAGTVTEGDFAP